MIPKKLVIASSNAGKIAEIRALLADLPIVILTQADFGIGDIPETAITFVENALIKARYVAEVTGLPALGDDSGLEVEALNGAPGIYSARYAGEKPIDFTRNVEKLLHEMANVSNRRARFKTVCVYLQHAADPSPLITEGTWEGEILTLPRGQLGFGYDPVFYIPSHDCSAAELSFEIKNQLSHRSKAFKKLREALY